MHAKNQGMEERKSGGQVTVRVRLDGQGWEALNKGEYTIWKTDTLITGLGRDAVERQDQERDVGRPVPENKGHSSSIYDEMETSFLI